MAKDIISVKDLRVWFQVRRGFIESILSEEERYVKAVDGVTFTIKEREIFCLVGESGCGKTTTGKAILRLVEPTGGEVAYFGPGKEEMMKEMVKVALAKDRIDEDQAERIMENGGIDLRALNKSRMKSMRQRLQIIFQDPYESLNPKQSIYDIVAEPLVVNSIGANEAEREERVKKALNDAGLRPPSNFMWRYPHEVSGGQRQRVGVAGALVLDPDFLVADEPVSMLDVSIRSDILKLMLDLREHRGLSFLFITHDLSVAYVFSDRIAVMYLGKIVEMGSSDAVIKNPQHPYTKALISVVPTPDPKDRVDKIILVGERPDPSDVPPGCRFHPRCPFVMDICKEEEPESVFVSEDGHSVCCHLLSMQGDSES